MALKATIFKAELQVADLERGYYATHSLTLARHPSETDERMMVRLLAFARHADPALEFTRGLCADEEPDLWLRDGGGEILLWIEVGLPDERRLRRACGRAREVVVYAYGGRSADIWWQRNGAELARCANLRVIQLPAAATQALAALTARTMRLDCTLQEGQIWVGNGELSVAVEPQMWLPAG